MSHPHAPRAAQDRNLLFGVLALHLDFVTRDALLAAMHAWLADKGKALGQHLLDRGDLRPDEHDALEGIVVKHLARHGGDAGRSLAAVPVLQEVRPQLEQLADDDLLATLGAAWGPATPSDPSATRPPSLGAATSAGLRFRVLRPHARGGLGVVSVALDTELNRQVALKEIREEHADDAASRARFVLEAEITGGLEHPFIVPVYGLGQRPDGRPFYAMRLIRGDSLREAVNRFHQRQSGPDFLGVEFRGLLRRFLDVCNAVAYAHARGVLHRDLKPANVMLGQFGETLVVDWGLAKAGRVEAGPGDETVTADPLRPATGATDLTVQGQALGTPAYMSPEQASGKTGQLGRATDVYSLGATLYYLLTGRAPFEETRVDLVLQKVRQGEYTPPRQVNARVPPALDAVCRRAMALSPAERYPTARALAADLERWLADEAVSAFTEPTSARVGRWARRHRPLVTGVAVLLVTAVVGLAAGLVLLNQKQRETEQARRDAVTNEARAREAEATANAHAEAATQAQGLALQTLDTVVFDIQKEMENKPGLQKLRRRLLDRATEGLREVARTAGRQGPRADRAAAVAQGDLGGIFFRTGHTQDARDQFERAVATLAALAGAAPDDAQVRHDLAVAYERLGDACKRQGDTRAALHAYRDAQKLTGELARADPGNAQFRRDLAVGFNKVGDVLLLQADTAQALQAYQAGLKLSAELAQADPGNARARRDLAVSYNKTGDVLLHQGETARALQEYREAQKLCQELARADPADAEAKRDLVVSCNNVGDVLLQQSETARALQSYQEGLKLSAELARADPDNTRAKQDLAISYNKVGDAYKLQGDLKSALQAYREDLKLSQELARADPDDAQARRDLSVSYERLGDVLLQQAEVAQALAAYRDALRLSEELARLDPEDAQARRDLAVGHGRLGEVYKRQGNFAEALKSYREALKINAELAQADPNDARARRDVSGSHERIGSLLFEQGDLKGALEAHLPALKIREEQARTDAGDAVAQTDLAVSYYKIGHVHEAGLDYEQAVPAWGQALTILQTLDRDGKLDGNAQFKNLVKPLTDNLAQARLVLRAVKDPDFARKQPREQARVLLDRRARVLARRNQLADARGAAAELAALADKDPAALYNAACAYAVCAAASPGPDADAAQALALLGKAHATGFFRNKENRDLLKGDKDFDPLRQREDFKKFLAEVEKAAKP